MKRMRPPTLPKEILEGLNKVYSEKSEIYDGMSQREDCSNQILKTVLKDVDFKGKAVLELGAGTGRFSIPLSMKARIVYALDKARPMLDILRRKMRTMGIRNIRVMESDYGRIALPKGSVDIAFSAWAFPHNSSSWERDLKEVRRLLKPHGKMLFIDNYYGSGEYVRMKRIVKGPGPLVSRQLEKFSQELHEWLASKGFKYRVIDTRVDFRTKRNVYRLCGPFFGYDTAAYLLSENKTSFGLKVSIFYGEK